MNKPYLIDLGGILARDFDGQQNQNSERKIGFFSVGGY